MNLILSEKIIGCAIKVYDQLGYGFLEKVYQKALCTELKSAGLYFTEEALIRIHYNEIIISESRIDILVENSFIIEIKTCSTLIKPHYRQQPINRNIKGAGSGKVHNFFAAFVMFGNIFVYFPFSFNNNKAGKGDDD